MNGSRERARKKYMLRGREIVATDSLAVWAEWIEKADRHVAQTDIDGIWVSTVFMGLDHNWRGVGAPILFETMVFDHSVNDEDRWVEIEGYFARYSTFDEAERGHQEIVARVRAALDDGKIELLRMLDVPSNRTTP